MSFPDKSIDPRLLATAREAFLSKGFEMASLAEICRAAGVTTGALYKRYDGKEALFSAIVADTVGDMERFVGEIEASDLSGYTDEALYESFAMKPADNLVWLRFLYERREGFTLLVRCASGTRYGNFRHDWAERMNRLDYKFYQEALRRGMTGKVLTVEEMHVLTSALWAMYYEPFIHGFTWEQMERHAVLIHQFINWHGALGIGKPG